MLVNLNDILIPARRGGYAVGLFNTTDTDMLEAVIGAAERTRSPVIIGTAEVLLPYGELKLIAPSLLAAAKRASVPVALHYDHGLTLERCREALELGFSSIMFDGSARPTREDNMSLTLEAVRMAHEFGATVEGEIGHVGEAANGDGRTSDMYTTPEEAVEFVSLTGVDALAVAIGTAHGAYKTRPCLDLNRLSAINERVSVPLVLHGGSGLSDDDFRNTVHNGISKINIFTDLCIAGERGMREGLAQGEGYLDIRNRKVAAISAEAERKMKIFGCSGKA